MLARATTKVASALASIVVLVLVMFLINTSDLLASNKGENTVRIMVELKNNSTDLLLENKILRRDGREIRKISKRAPEKYLKGERLISASDLRRWRILEVSADQASNLVQDLQSSAVVQDVYFERIYQMTKTPDDIFFTEQYGLHSDSSPLADIDAPEAWDVTIGSSNTVIAIVDGGVDLGHEDLKDKVWVNTDEIAGNGIDDDGNGYIDDRNGWDFVSSGGQNAGIAIHDHATHVAGIATASGNNGVGIAGVDWQAKIMSVRALGNSGLGREEHIIAGIEYAVSNGADVINLSIAGLPSGAIQQAIENAYAAGVVVVAAAGNSGIDLDQRAVYPVCADTDGVNMVLGVAATDDKGEPARFSNYGSCIDISAPGDDILSSRSGDRYKEMTGTSMSSPMVAGAAGLYLARNPSAKPADVITAIKQAKSFTGPDEAEWNENYKGMLNLPKMLGVSSNTGPGVVPINPGVLPSIVPPIVSMPTPSNGGGGGDGGSGGGGGGGGDCCPGPDPNEEGSRIKSTLSANKKIAGVVLKKANLSLVPKINSAFRQVFGRNPIVTEHAYWLGRVQRGEKRSFVALMGAMSWQKILGRTYDPNYKNAVTATSRVAGVKISGGALINKINSIHRRAFNRNPSIGEHSYWLGRVKRSEKTTENALYGAMIFHRLAGIKH